MSKKLNSLLAVLTVLAAACGGAGAGGGQIEPDGPWLLSSGTSGGNPIQLIDSHPVTLVVDGSRISGTAACNGYGGNWSLNGSAVTISEVAQTEMACEPMETMDLERTFLEALTKVDTAAIVDDQLVLTGSDIELRFDEQQPAPTADLLGTVWALDSLVSGDVVSSVTGDPTLEFYSDGSFIGTTGCRNLTGNYEEAGAGIDVPIMSAHGDCTPDLADQDDHIVNVIGDGFDAAIEGGTLTLTIAGGDGLVYRARTTG